MLLLERAPLRLLQLPVPAQVPLLVLHPKHCRRRVDSSRRPVDHRSVCPNFHLVFELSVPNHCRSYPVCPRLQQQLLPVLEQALLQALELRSFRPN